MPGSDMASVASLLLLVAVIRIHAANSQRLPSELNSLSLVYGCVHHQASKIIKHAEDAVLSLMNGVLPAQKD